MMIIMTFGSAKNVLACWLNAIDESGVDLTVQGFSLNPKLDDQDDNMDLGD